MQGGGIHHLRDIIEDDSYNLDPHSLQAVLASLQTITDNEVSEIVDRLIEKLLQGVLHLRRHPEDEVCRLMASILVYLAQRASHLSNHQTLAAFRIILNCPAMLSTSFADVESLFAILASKIGLNAVLGTFQGIYNELKFTVSVGACKTQIGDSRKNISEYTASFAKMIEALIRAIDGNPEVASLEGTVT